MSPENPGNRRIPNPILLIFIIIQLILIIAVSLSISQLNRPDLISQNDYEAQPKATVENIESILPDLSSYDISDIERNIFAAVNQDQSDTKTDINVSIRSDTLRTIYFEKPNINFFSTIIDIPTISKSYQLYYSYSHSDSKAPNNFISILCPSDNNNCKEPEKQPSRQEIAYRYLRYFNFNYFTPTINPGELNKVYINPTLNTLSEQEAKSYVSQTKEAIESLGISSQLFEYYVLQPEEHTYNILK